jgi:hypothetical protein
MSGCWKRLLEQLLNPVNVYVWRRSRKISFDNVERYTGVHAVHRFTHPSLRKIEGLAYRCLIAKGIFAACRQGGAEAGTGGAGATWCAAGVKQSHLPKTITTASCASLTTSAELLRPRPPALHAALSERSMLRSLPALIQRSCERAFG